MAQAKKPGAPLELEPAPLELELELEPAPVAPDLTRLDFAVLGGLCSRDHLLAPDAMMEYLAQVRAAYIARFPQ